MFKKVVAFLCGAVLIAGCDKIPFFNKKKEEVKETKKNETLEPINIRGPLLAKVNNWQMGLDDFNERIEKTEKLLGGKKKIGYEEKRKMLNELVKTEILAQIAKERGIDKREDTKRLIRTTTAAILAAQLRQEIEKEVSIPFKEVKGLYEAGKEQFKNPKNIKIREIVVNSESQARDLYIRLLQGDDFVSLATQYSVSSSAKKGGDLGYTNSQKDKKFKKFWEVVDTLDKGEISNIFQGEDGKYYIVKVEDIKGGEVIPFSKVEEALKIYLKSSKVEKKIDSLIDDFKKNSEVEINENLLR